MRAVSPLALLALLVSAWGVEAQRVAGHVVDAAARSPIPAATIRLLRGDTEVAGTVSDSAGRFSLAAPGPGRYRLHAARLGYRDAASAPMELSAEASVTAELAMSVEAVGVATIEVSVPRDRYLEVRGFYERMESGAGDYLTADQVRRRSALTLADLLRGMRGVKIQRVNWKSEVYLAGADCLPQIVVDGITVRYGGKTVQATGAQTIEDLVNVSHIQGVEVYRGSSGVPLEFEGPNAACGVIVLWTRVR